MEDARKYHILDMACYRQLHEIVASTLGFADGQKSEEEITTASGVHRSGSIVNTTTLINDFIVDLCEQSSPEKGLCFSDPYFKFIIELKKFCFANIYNNWRLVEFGRYAENVLGCIYRTLQRTQVYAKNHRIEQCLKYMPRLGKTFTNWLIKYTNYDEDQKKIMKCQTAQVFDIFSDESYEKCIIEYISGMTDQFAISVFEEIVSF